MTDKTSERIRGTGSPGAISVIVEVVATIVERISRHGEILRAQREMEWQSARALQDIGLSRFDVSSSAWRNGRPAG